MGQTLAESILMTEALEFLALSGFFSYILFLSKVKFGDGGGITLFNIINQIVLFTIENFV